MADDDEIVARLRASRAESRKEDEEAGKEKGADWARQAASWRELQRCERLYDLVCRENVAVTPYSFVAEVLKTDSSGKLRDFCETWVGDGDEDGEEATPDFMDGFLEGAIKAWREISHKVDIE